MYKTILVAVDTAQMEKAERIFLQAGQLAAAGGRVLMVNVVEELPAYVVSDLSVDMLVDARNKAEGQLLELQKKTGVKADIEIRQGSPAKEILAAAETAEADLIIIASHVPDLTNYIIGATADRIVRHAKCSVLIDRRG
ncbi:universal stress protein [Neorhizobium sp. NCHU2750]|uniref:universal stress protein n=1 Tax=Neorhizobium sp. NCHU2750 TaxID=1825976 RepID=UPI000E7446CF|nr:universal stress protein [Neorhizobium sp. NCHU2750]